MHHALKHEPIEIWGDGSVVRDYVYIGDVVSAFVKTIEYTGAVRTFNIGSGRGVSLNELIETIESLLGSPIQRVWKRARPVDVPVNVLDIAKARTFLMWEPHTSLQEGLTRTVDWINNHGFNRASGG